MSDAAVASSATLRPLVARAALVLAAAFVVAAVVVVTWRAGPKPTSATPAIEVPGSAMQASRGTARVVEGAIVLERPDAGGVTAAVAANAPFDAAEFTRATWRLALAAPENLEVAMLWRTRERPDRTFVMAIDASHESVDVDLAANRDWKGTIVGIGLAVRGTLDVPLPVLGVELRSNAWDATFADMLSEWAESPFRGGRTAIAQLSFEESHIAPFLAVVAAAVALALAWLAFRAWRRKERVAPAMLAAVFLLGWLAVDVRWQMLLWREHAAAWRQFAGRTLDEKYATTVGGPIFEVARRLRDADRPKAARVLVLSRDSQLATRVAWPFFPENVYTDSRPRRYVAPPGPGELRTGDQVVLLLYDAIRWDRDRGVLVWKDGATRAGREILSDGPELSFVEVR